MVNAVALAGFGFHAAEDAVQEALLRAWTNDEVTKPIARLDAWVTVVAWNHGRSGLRRLGAERRAQDRLAHGLREQSDPEPAAGWIDVTRALGSLPRRQREIAVLRYVLDVSTADVADALGISEGTVKSSLADARQALSRVLRPNPQEATDAADR